MNNELFLNNQEPFLITHLYPLLMKIYYGTPDDSLSILNKYKHFFSFFNSQNYNSIIDLQKKYKKKYDVSLNEIDTQQLENIYTNIKQIKDKQKLLNKQYHHLFKTSKPKNILYNEWINVIECFYELPAKDKKKISIYNKDKLLFLKDMLKKKHSIKQFYFLKEISKKYFITMEYFLKRLSRTNKLLLILDEKTNLLFNNYSKLQIEYKMLYKKNINNKQNKKDENYILNVLNIYQLFKSNIEKQNKTKNNNDNLLLLSLNGWLLLMLKRLDDPFYVNEILLNNKIKYKNITLTPIEAESFLDFVSK